MAGDRITASTLYYYAAAGPSSNPNILPTVLNNLLALIGGNATSGEMIHSAGSGITSQLNTNPNFMNAVEPSNATTGTPQAYLTILFFDERFTLIPAANGGVQQLQVRSSDAGNVNASALLLQNIQAPKNGYAYIYISNRSDQDVFFDNFTVSVTAGNIIEEDHYYPFGLKIAAISSHKLGDAAEGKLSNPYLYNGKEMLDENAGLNWYDYGFRNYDPQIGRFPQLDPLTDDYPELTPFQYGSNDPITNIDIDGLEGAAANTWSSGSSAVSDLLNVGKWTAAGAAHFSSTANTAATAISAVSLVKTAMTAIKIAAVVVRAQIANKTLNKGESSPAVMSMLDKVIDDYTKEHLDLTDDDIFQIGVAAKNYLRGLSFMAFWSHSDFDQLDRTVISGGDGHLSDLKRAAIVDGGISDEQQGFRGIMHEGANTGFFIASAGLFPEVGTGPRLSFGAARVAAAKEGGELGRKLDYAFGKATGRLHNIERSTNMLRQLESVGIFDNTVGRTLLKSHLEQVYDGVKGILQSNGYNLRESLLMGPRGALKVESLWDGNRLITIKFLGGK